MHDLGDTFVDRTHECSLRNTARLTPAVVIGRCFHEVGIDTHTKPLGVSDRWPVPFTVVGDIERTDDAYSAIHRVGPGLFDRFAIGIKDVGPFALR